MDPVSSLLTSLGISVGSQVVYDAAKAIFNRKQGVDKDEFASQLANEVSGLTLDNAQVLASTIVDFFAQHGFITIRGSSIYANETVWMRSAHGTTLTFGDGSTSETKTTRIDAGKGAEIRMTGGAQIRQNPDGSISFLT